MKKKATIWWGLFQLKEQQARFWEIGPLSLSVEKNNSELRILHYSDDDIDQYTIHAGVEKLAHFSEKKPAIKRFLLNKNFDKITVTPMLSDRSQVSLPEIPFYLPAHERITLYISSPIWVRIEAGEPQYPLLEISSVQQSDTWHGPDTHHGELCYASSSFCRTSLDDLPARSNRVITPVIVQNDTKTPLLIEKMSLPLPFLSIYADENGNLWTEEIIIKNEVGHKQNIRQGKGAPSIAKEAKLLTTPRLQFKAHNVINMFYSLLVD